MIKTLGQLKNCFEHTLVSCNGETECLANEKEKIYGTKINSLVFDSRQVTEGALFFALPGTHTTGNKFISSALKNGAAAVVFEGSFSSEEKEQIQNAISETKSECCFIKVNSSRFAMSPVSACFYDNPSEKLIVYGVTGTEGKSSTVAFIWQLLMKNGIKSGFISTVQYSLGGEAIANPEHQTTPEAPIVQKELYEMVQNGCQCAVVESSSHGLSKKTNRLGDVLFDCSIFMNVTLEHLEFHKTYDQYKFDKANLFRALEENSHTKIICGKETKINSCGIVNLDDDAAKYFADCTTKKIFGFTTKNETYKNSFLEKKDILYLDKIESSSCDLSFSFLFDEKKYLCKANVPGAFNAFNLSAALLAISYTQNLSLEKIIDGMKSLESVKGRMTVINQNQPFEVIVDYAHTPSSFQTIFPPVRQRAKGKMLCLFGSGGERDLTKRPIQGEIAAKYCDTVILTDEDPRGEDSVELLEMIAKGSRKAGKTDNKDLFIIPDRPKAIRYAFSIAEENDIVLLLGKSHENSIIYKDYVMKYDEIAEAKKALEEMGYKK